MMSLITKVRQAYDVIAGYVPFYDIDRIKAHVPLRICEMFLDEHIEIETAFEQLEKLEARATPHQPTTDNDGYERCPHCKNLLSFGDNFCSMCGQALKTGENE